MRYEYDLKLRSSMTLFAEAAPEEDVFRRVLDKFFVRISNPGSKWRLKL